MKSFIKFLLSIIIVLTSLLGIVVALCVVDPTLADDIAEFLYKRNVISRPAPEDIYAGDGELTGGEQSDIPNPAAPRDDAGQGRDAGKEDKTYLTGELREEEDPDKDSKPVNAVENPNLDDAIAGNAPESSYVAPDTGNMNIPKDLENRSDYQDIKAEEAEVTGDSLTALKESLDEGHTGDDLSFDPLFYPYYHMLNDTGKHVYRQIYANAMARNKAFSPVEPIGRTGLRTVIEAMFNDQPQLFWLETSYACKYKSSGECVEIDLTFNRTAGNFEKENTAFMQTARRIEAEAAKYSSDVDKERFVHDSIIDMVDYVRSAEMSQSAYSALVNKKSVCAGYARAYQLIMQELGIPCYYCVGSAGEDHAWNIVKLGDGYYNVDLTWDDTEVGKYDFFNKTDEDYAPTHIRKDLSVRLPACNASKYREEDEDPAERARRSMEELGYSPSDVLYNIDAYYNDCSYKIKNLGTGSHKFSSLVSGEELYNEIEALYSGNAYREAFLESTMRAVGASSCKMSLEIERLKGGIYLIGHNITLS